MSKHTPGPWKARARCVTNDGTQDEMAGLGWNIEGPREPSRGQFSKAADACLVAAAPDLLEALVAMMDFVNPNESLPTEEYPALSKAYAALAKANPLTKPSKSYR